MPYLSLPSLDSLPAAGMAIGTIFLLYVAVMKAIVPIVKWLIEVGGRIMGAIDNLAGRDPRVDRATGKIIEGIPAIGERFGSIEEKLDRLENTDARLNGLDARLNIHEGRLNEHDTAIGLIGGGQFERGSEALLRATELANKDVIDVDEP